MTAERDCNTKEKIWKESALRLRRFLSSFGCDARVRAVSDGVGLTVGGVGHERRRSVIVPELVVRPARHCWTATDDENHTCSQ